MFQLNQGLRAVALGLAGFAATVSAAQAEGVPVGADKATYVEAFKDIDPMVLQVQTAGSPGGVIAIYMEKYAAALDEWSGGKLTFDIAYGQAIQKGESSPAVSDGRLFFASVLPMYKPSDYPKNAAFAGMIYDPGHSPLVSVLQFNAAASDAALQVPELYEEYAEDDVTLAIGGFPGLPMTLFCSEPHDTLDSLQGSVVRTSGTQHARQVEGLGMSSASMPWGEIFESLQRGVIDCALTHSMVYTLGGLDQVAPYASLPDNASFAAGNSAIAFDKTGFEELPLVARQLLIDRLDVYFEHNMRAYLREALKANAALIAAGGKRTQFDEAADAKLREITATIKAENAANGPFDDNAAVFKTIEDTQDKWYKILEETGYVAMDKGWDNVNEWLDPETIDMAPFMARFSEEVIQPLRPSE